MGAMDVEHEIPRWEGGKVMLERYMTERLSRFFSLTVQYDWTGLLLTDTYHISLMRDYDEA
jgi:hypothetical protein